jgi:hypothetical protein
VHHADQRLSRRQRADDLLAEGFFLDAGDEFLDHRQGHIGFEQGHAHLAQHVGDVVFGQTCLAAEILDDAAEALGEVVEHGRGLFQRESYAIAGCWRMRRTASMARYSISVLAGRDAGHAPR